MLLPSTFECHMSLELTNPQDFDIMCYQQNLKENSMEIEKMHNAEQILIDNSFFFTKIAAWKD